MLLTPLLQRCNAESTVVVIHTTTAYFVLVSGVRIGREPICGVTNFRLLWYPSRALAAQGGDTYARASIPLGRLPWVHR